MILVRKVWRDLIDARLALSGILAVVAIGVATFVALGSVDHTLRTARDTFYLRHRLPDARILLRRLPTTKLSALQRDPAIRAVRGRVVESVQVELGHLRETVPGEALSLPVPRQPILSDITVVRGAWFTRPDAHEVMLGHSFASARGLDVGDHLAVLVNGTRLRLLVVGITEDPEHVFMLPPGGGLTPDPAGFALLFMPRQLLAGATGLTGGCNQLLLTLKDPRSDHLDETLARLSRDLQDFGVLAAGPIRDVPSVQILDDKIQGMRGSTIIVPVLFLGMAGLVLHVMLGRLATQQRIVLGTLRALGYSRIAVAGHLVCFGLITGFLGGLLGILAGRGLEELLLVQFRLFFPMPGLEASSAPSLYFLGIAMAMVAGAAGAMRSAWIAAGLAPATAMRPPPPERGGRIFLEIVPALWNLLGFGPKMVLRAIFRNPFRSAVGVLGTALATAMIFCQVGLLDSVDYLMKHQYTRTQHQDATVRVREPVGSAAIAELARHPDVLVVESQLEVSVELGSGARTQRVALTGLHPRGRLTTPLDKAGRPVVIPDRGLILAERLARDLWVRAGDRVRLRPLVGERRPTWASVVAVVDVYVGIGAWCSEQFLGRLLGEERATSALQLQLLGGEMSPALTDYLAARPEVTQVTTRRRALELFEKNIAGAQRSSMGVLVILLGMLAFATILNNGLVSLGERRREFGTLRTLGYTPGAVTWLFLAEGSLLAGTGILVGVPLGRTMIRQLARAYDTELFRFPVHAGPGTTAATVMALAVFLVLAQAVVYWVAARLDWQSALKVKE